MTTEVGGSAMTDEIKPNVDENGAPWCAESDCQSYDGNACRATGFSTDGICEPAVIDMAERLRQAHAARAAQ